MFENGKFPADYVWNAKESFELQLEALDEQPLTELQQKYFLRNLLISLELHFVSRDASLELEGGSLQELRDAAILMVHDAKLLSEEPISRSLWKTFSQSSQTPSSNSSNPSVNRPRIGRDCATPRLVLEDEHCCRHQERY
jgi:hypothetical protein